MRVLLFSFFALVASGAVSAEEPPEVAAPEPSLSQVALTEDMVTRFLASYPEATKLSLKFSKRTVPPRSTEDRLRVLGELPLLNEAQAELKDIAARHGFDDTAQWSAAGQSVVLAHAYAKSGRKPGEERSQMLEAIEKIERSTHLSDADKKRFVELLQESQGFVGPLEPSASNIEIVEKMGDAVGAVLDQ